MPIVAITMFWATGTLLAISFWFSGGWTSPAPRLKSCGGAPYDPSQYTCYDSDFLCPIVHGEPTLRCGDSCYLPEEYSCFNGELGQPLSVTPGPAINCPNEPATLHLSDPPYENYFYSDCRSASQVVVTSPLPDSDLSLIGPRLLVAWPAGNSGVVSFFAPTNGKNGSLAIELVESSTRRTSLSPVFRPSTQLGFGGHPQLGIGGVLRFNSSAILTLAILGSVRSIRDFTEGGSIIAPAIQKGIKTGRYGNGGAELSRVWLNNVTTTYLSFVPVTGKGQRVEINGNSLKFQAGDYHFSASFDYPQLTQLSAQKVLDPASQDLITQQSDRAKSLAFLSYSDKLLAGAWRFLTYFGRDSSIALMLMQSILSGGQDGAIEAVISALLERLNYNSGSVCHEETIGDYALYLVQENAESTAPSCSYIMIDSDYYLPIVMRDYFVNTDIGQSRKTEFLRQRASLDFGNSGRAYGDLALRNAVRIMNLAAPFAAPGNQTKENLRHLKPLQIVGQWRDSEFGIGGGRIPFDVNTALVPAALRAISDLSAAGFFQEYPEWAKTAASNAKVWEDSTLDFFSVTVPESEAKSLVKSYVKDSKFEGSSQTSAITGPVKFHGLALDGNNGQSIVKVMNTDFCFRLFLLNTTHDAQLTDFLDQTAQQILMPFPAGLSVDLGLFVANPAYGGDPVYAKNFTRVDYHGTVVWGWQMSMAAVGLQRQLGRCSSDAESPPAFCNDKAVYGNVKRAYNHLWDLIEANEQLLSFEVWSWKYSKATAKFDYVGLGALSATGA